jgi:polyisoprenoid-binding protein YceI
VSKASPTRSIEGVDVPAPGLWRIDTAHTNVGFVARYLMLTKVRGRFTEFSGSIHVEENPADSWAELSIAAASIDTSNPDRDTHLRSPDFLDVARFPTINFRSTDVKLGGRSNLQVTGDLTIRGQTRSVVLDVEYLGVTPDVWGNTRVAFSAAAEIDRTEFGASWNVALETGGVLVGRQVQLDIEAQAVFQADEAEEPDKTE